MSQYKIGTISVTNGSAVVAGSGTAWLANASVGDLIALKNENVWYEILTVDSDTQITLTTNYAGTTQADKNYMIQRDFTPNSNFPIPTYGDEGAASLIAKTLMSIDANLATLSPTHQVLDGNINLTGSVSINSAVQELAEYNAQQYAQQAAASAALASQTASQTLNIDTAHAEVEADRAEVAANKDLTYGYKEDAASAVAYQDLTSIAESKVVTAVDVFIYDTSKDSDGGAWRHRCQHTSWYNETLSTATRGARREFPSVAVIVAEADAVTIYDGDDPSLPMWMVFNRGGSYPEAYILGRGAINNTSVIALNGVVCVGIDTVGYGEALAKINFLSDGSVMHSSSNSFVHGQNIAGRNTFTTLTVTNAVANIVNNVVNDIAMTVLSDAPVDVATGLPVPTIAVGTDGGVSVITHDGDVWDVSSGQAIVSLDISSIFELIACRSNGTVEVWDNVASIGSDGVAADSTLSNIMGTAAIVEAA